MRFLVGFLALVAGLVPYSASSMEVAAKDTPQTRELPIVMYHNILKSRNGRYALSPEKLENDFTAILSAGFTPVFMSEVIDWVDGKGSLPNKPIVITFDDGHYNNLYYGLPIAKKLGVKFMINPVTSFSKHTADSGDHSNPNYSHITWAQMKEAVDSGLVEIGNHTHRMHRFKPRFGILKMDSENFDDYTAALKSDIEYAQELIEQSGVPRPLTFAYPFGKYSKDSRELLVDMGFRALLTCNERVSTITQYDSTTLHNLGRFNRDGGISIEKLIQKICKE